MSFLSYPPDKKIQNYSFSFKAKVGKGAYGTVFAGKNSQTNQVVALKVIDKKLLQTDYANQLIASEIEIMKKIDNKNIVKLIDVLQSINNTYIITEYCNGGDLREHLKKKKQLSENDALQIFKDLLYGIKALLKIGIIHRDIKPANIMIHEGVFKLTDFGFAKQVDSHMDAIMNSLVGTPLYMSPQILKRQKYTSKCDIWSIGLILYEMIYGVTPWHSQNLVELMAKLDQKPLQFPPQVRVSENTKLILKCCLQINEENRITWNQLFNMVGLDEQVLSPISQQQDQSFKYSIYRGKQRTESMCFNPIHPKHNRSFSNTQCAPEQTIETAKGTHRPKLSYLDNNQQHNTSRLRTDNVQNEENRDRSNSYLGNLRFNTQRVELQKYLENAHTPPIPLKKYGSTKSNNDSFRTPSALQSHSTNASNRMHYEQKDENVKINDFVADEFNRKNQGNGDKQENEDREIQFPLVNNSNLSSNTRIKRTNSLSNNINLNLSPIMNQKKGYVQQLMKFITNQLELLSPFIQINQSINKLIYQHQKLVQQATTDQIYSNNDLIDVKCLINGLQEYLNKNSNASFINQIQVLLLLMINYYKIIQFNVQSKSLQLTNSLKDLLKKNQQIQTNQVRVDSKTLRQNIQRLL